MAIYNEVNKNLSSSINVLSLFDGISCGYLALQRAGLNIDTYYASEIEPHAEGISKYHFPDIVRLGDVNNYNDWELKHIDLMIGGSPCFEAGNKVFTRKGYINIEDIKVGDLVLTHTGKYRKVVKVGNSISKTVELHCQGMLGTRVTLNHPYLCKKDGIIEWTPVKKLEKNNSLLATPLLFEEENEYNLSKEDCWILGRYLADGHCRKTKRPKRKNSYQYQLVLSIGNDKVENVKEHIKTRHYSCFPHSKSTHRIVFSSMELVDFVLDQGFGTNALEKKIPNFVYHLPNELAMEFIEGYMSGDGCYIEKTDYFSATTVSRDLAMGLCLLVAKCLKTNPKIYHDNRPKQVYIEDRLVNQHDTYIVRYGNRIKTGSKCSIDNNYLWNPVKGIDNLKENVIVYNIEVEEDHSYILNNFVVHNCQDLSIAKANREGLNGEKSGLFWKYVDCLKKFKPDYFLLENNYSMPKAARDVITEALGVEPIMINSDLVSAQNRKRLYWTNIPGVEQPKDKGIILQDILESGTVDRQKSLCVTRRYAGFHGSQALLCRRYFGKSFGQAVFEKDINTIKQQWKENPFFESDDNNIRQLTITECERLQTLPDDYTKYEVWKNEVRETPKIARYEAVGNGWTVDVISHILGYLK